jgi:diguanylate cyclase (GGDEF)-like protein
VKARDPRHSVETFEHEVRVQSVRVGVWLTAMVTAIVVAYSLATWDRPHRALLIGIVFGATASAVGVLAMPIERIARSRWREPFFLSWSALNVLMVSVLVVLDGTDESPLALIYVLPLVFAASSYPLGMTIAISIADVGACLAVGLSDGGPPDRAMVLTGLLTAAAFMCALQARNHDRQREVLSRVSRTDPLTDVLNRRGFEKPLDAALRAAARSEEPLALLLLDLDGFKWVNDRDGHVAGDELLRWAAQQIAKCVRPGDTVGRIGGDEFAVLAPAADGSAARALAKRIAAVLEHQIGVSIGIAGYPSDAETVEDLHRTADERLYGVKRGRTGRAAGVIGPATVGDGAPLASA